MLVSVNNGGFQLGGGTESEARFKTPSFNVSDDVTIDPGQSPVRLRWQRRVLDVALAGQRSIAGAVHLRRIDHRTSARRLSQRQTAVAHPGDAELARHEAVVSRLLRTGHVEAVAEDDAQLRSAVGARTRAADPQRRDLQLQRRSLQQQHQDDAVCQCTAWIPLSR